jgi:hypothetical protein
MTTVSLSFPGPLSTKRRRMRSGGGATLTNNNSSMNGDATGNSNNDLPSSISTQPQPSPPPQSDDVMNTNNNYDEENISEQKTTQTSKCKGATTIPIFLKSAFIYNHLGILFCESRVESSRLSALTVTFLFFILLFLLN